MSYKPLCLLALLACTAVHAQNHVRVDYCNADPLSRRVADATAILVPKSQVHLNPGGATYTLDTTPFTAPFLGEPICSDQPYYNQVRALQGRTGFLIGSHTLMTAAHGPTAQFDPANYAVIFNWRWIENGAQPQTSPDRDCRLQSDPSAIPFADVYFAALSPDPKIPPGDPYNTRESTTNPADFMIFQLERDVAGVTPLPLRRTGEPLLGDALIVPGHPFVLPLKIASGARVVRMGPNGIGTGQPWVSIGNSGSPVFNARAQVVETAISRGNLLTGWSWNSSHTCMVETSSIVVAGAENNSVENSSVKVLPVSELPTMTALEVSPLNVVRHTVVGTSVTNQSSSFTVSLPAAAPASVNYFVSNGVVAADNNYTPMATAAQLKVKSAQGTEVTGYVQTISPGQSQRYTVDVESVPNDCEQTETEIRIRPTTPGAFDSVITHRFETNQRSFVVSPDTKWTLSSFAPPYPTRTLTLRNPTTINQSITVNSSASWLLVNGATSTTVVIAPQGSAGDSVTLTLSIAPTADIDVPPGTTGNARVTINAGSTRCQERGPDEIDVEFTNGILELFIPDTAGTYLPAPSGGATYGTPREVTFDLSAYSGLLVGDVNVGPSFYVMSPSPPAQVPTSLMVEVDSPNPSGTRHVVKVWDGQTAPADYFTSIGMDTYRLTLDDETTPPLAGTLLSDFDNEGIAGLWKVRLYNRTSNGIVPDGMMLRLVRKP